MVQSIEESAPCNIEHNQKTYVSFFWSEKQEYMFIFNLSALHILIKLVMMVIE